MKPKLSILIPTVMDYDGVYFTVQQLRQNNDLSKCEILLGDGKPDAPMGGEFRRMFGVNGTAGLLSHGTAGTRYIDTSKADGTAPAKELLIQEASGEAIICMDAHVLLAAGAINALVSWYDANPGTPDLFTGPMMYDNLAGLSTHFDNVWRGEMWGIWGAAWRTPCQEGGDGDLVSVREGDDGKIAFYSLEWDAVPLTRSLRCGVDFPKIGFAGHEEALKELGFTPMGWSKDDDFEIPGNGMGLFTCRKDVWPGFNPSFRGFGGEEMYIHEKIRRRGGATRCLGFLQWLHRFAKPFGIPYRLTQWDKARNYVIGLQELGLPVEPVHELFVTGEKAKVSQYKWERLLADPLQSREPVDPVAIPNDANFATVESLYGSIQRIKRDLDQHMPLLSELAAKCSVITELSHRRESLIAFARPQTAEIDSFNTESNDPAINQLLSFGLDKRIKVLSLSSDKISEHDVRESDLLFIDQEHTYARVSADLKRFSPKTRRYIVLHDTMLHANRGEDGGPGIGTAIMDFIEEFPEWFIARHEPKQHGLTVLGRLEEDRPEKTVTPWPPAFGPGTELHKMLASIGINPDNGCSCRRLIADMNVWGTAKCADKRDYIIDQIHQNYQQWGWRERIGLVAAGGKAIITGLAFKIDVFNPIESMVDEAIRRSADRDMKKAVA